MFAQVGQHGRSLLLGATLAQYLAGARAGQVLSQGSAEQKAAAVLAYLREHRLIDF